MIVYEYEGIVGFQMSVLSWQKNILTVPYLYIHLLGTIITCTLWQSGPDRYYVVENNLAG